MQLLHYKKHSNKFPIPVLALALVLLINLASLTSSCTEQDRSSLLKFLRELSQDGGLSASWQDGTDCCKWDGIACSQDGTVTDVSLASRSLQGNISPSLGNLTGLLRLNLSHNMLSGALPQELVSSSSIIVVDVSFNRLNGGLNELPSSTPIRPLQVLNISSNLFTGQFPSSIWDVMKNLVALNVSSNKFTGKIPTRFCDSSSNLSVLELCYNQFSGSIPSGLGNCSMLKVLKAGHNKLSGTLPGELFNDVSLEYLSFPNNNLHGEIDGTQIAKLRNLVTLDLGGNQFIGKIPDSVSQLKRLEELHLDSNMMSGELPGTLGSCTNLSIIDLKHNNFSGDLGKVNFSALHNLKTLDLYFNNFTGTIPESIYSCSNLTALRLSGNHFHGELSPGIINLKYLSFFSLDDNKLTNITKALQILKSCSTITTLLIGHNFRGEVMPQDESIDGFGNLQVLDINSCLLSGKIPLWLSRLTNLEMLLLNGNQLTGPIPRWIDSLNHLFYIDVSDNRLTEEIPITLMNLPMLRSTSDIAHLDPGAFELPVYNGPSFQYRTLTGFPTLLNLSHNNFIGVISPMIGQLEVLVVLDFSFNNLSGQIPQSICNLTSLQVLHLSNNHLTGEIPPGLSNLNFLSAFNISNNDLEGPIPTGGQFDTFSNSSFEGNPKLCDSRFNHHCSSAEASSVSRKEQNKKIVLAISFGVFFGGICILLLVGCFFVSERSKRFITKNSSDNNGDLEAASFNSDSEHSLIMMTQGKGEEINLTFADIVKATNNFDKAHIIGCGGYGLVYKAELPDGSKIAIKKLNSEMCLTEREFSAEVDALSMAQHANLVPFWGYCIQGNLRLLIYSLMENGSLDDWLHNRDDDASSFLDWPTRLKIALGASQGLHYIHDVCKPHIVHRDIKSSNILLDKEFKSYIADFGLSRLVLPNITHVTTELVGTLGYIPPEYGQSWVATLRGDMYSFGVVLLELLTGRRPVPILSTSEELVPWVHKMRSEGKQIEVLDPTFRGTGCEEQMLKVLETACKCVDCNPLKRPTIMEVVTCLDSIGTEIKI
uniref:non-specific serine/threonine protein kinase n=1 Tax=Oryza sativa subsp. indica TaxID=39946 RepID=Q66QA6_ORYSI|nr:putative leucine-rich repeat receptor-like kinase [Oryza sativa Indica Group]AAU12609.1 putative leucine-rich repeat receptor-like kinase [Oryza sativa Indica Group]ABA41561.1 putative leucine-rich repeat receptor-like kinase [Oryza sativa Indica Group]